MQKIDLLQLTTYACTLCRHTEWRAQACDTDPCIKRPRDTISRWLQEPHVIHTGEPVTMLVFGPHRHLCSKEWLQVLCMPNQGHAYFWIVHRVTRSMQQNRMQSKQCLLQFQRGLRSLDCMSLRHALLLMLSSSNNSSSHSATLRCLCRLPG